MGDIADEHEADFFDALMHGDEPGWEGEDYQSTKGCWIDKFGNDHPIKDMETSYIINCMKLLEKTTFARIKGFKPELKREMVEVALKKDTKYRELEAELFVRFKKRQVTLGDFFFCAKRGGKKLFLGR